MKRLLDRGVMTDDGFMMPYCTFVGKIGCFVTARPVLTAERTD
jgi:hypothetical protein